MFSIFRRKREAAPTAPIDYIVVGLGNPGPKYETTRHNAGFLAADLLAERLGAGRLTRAKHKATFAIAKHKDKNILIMKPQTYMNLSGEAVREMSGAYNVAPQNIIVMYDDVNIHSGKLRLKRSGSDGGHNGIKSIIYQLNSDAFPRVKIGISTPGGADMKDYVMDELDSDSYAGVKAAPQAALDIIEFGMEQAMQNFNGKSFIEEEK